MAVDIFSFLLVIFLPCLAVMTTWIIRSKIKSYKTGKDLLPSLQTEGVSVPSDVVTSILMLERRCFQVMEKLLSYEMISQISKG